MVANSLMVLLLLVFSVADLLFDLFAAADGTAKTIGGCCFAGGGVAACRCRRWSNEDSTTAGGGSTANFAWTTRLRWWARCGFTIYILFLF
jgi:hypothetical protein